MRKFLSVLLIAGIFLSSSIVHAEVKTYTGADEYFIGERETIEQAKEHSKIRALRNAREQAGIYIRSSSRAINLQLVEDEILTIAEGVVKIVGTPNFEQRALEGGKGILLVTTITVEIDTEEVNRQLEKFISRQKPPENVSSPPVVDNIALSRQKVEEADKLRATGKFKDSLPLYNEAIELNPNNASAFNKRGDSLNKIGKHKEAFEDFKKAIQLEPNNPWHHDCLAWTYNCLVEHKKAISACNKAIELDPNYSYAYNTRGWAYLGLKNYRQAIDNYTKAIQLESNKYWAYYVGRGKCYEALGQHDKARADFAKARQLGWKG